MTMQQRSIEQFFRRFIRHRLSVPWKQISLTHVLGVQMPLPGDVST
jgi:hypothetical protein